MSDSSKPSTGEAWARFRFSVIGHLLAAPPEDGELQRELDQLAKKTWKHPSTGEKTTFAFSTIERWYYDAKRAGDDPVAKLRRRTRKDRGQIRAVSQELQEVLHGQYRQHPSWSYQLHADNIGAVVDARPQLGNKPSYSTVRRLMKSRGLLRKKRKRGHRAKQVRDAVAPFEAREVRSYEAEHVHGLWHLDFHECSRGVILPSGECVKPQLLGILDDHSRLCCHIQWYLSENAENLVHGLIQAILKRGMPRSLLTDNGKAMTAAETEEGLERLGILHPTTLPYSPHQNAKQEAFWGPVEGRLIAMLEGVEDLKLDLLNRATHAWVEMEYQRSEHTEIGEPPLTRFTRGPSVGRESPSFERLRQAFTRQVSRAQRRSDGTFLLHGVRFELPSRFRHFERVTVRYAKWDMSYVHIVDPQADVVLGRVWPLDKTRNAGTPRRRVDDGVATSTDTATPTASGMAPLLRQYLDQHADTGLPPAYLPKPVQSNVEGPVMSPDHDEEQRS